MNNSGVVLDLNGYTLSRSGESTDHGIIYLYAGNLTIRDSSSAGTGKITSDITGQKYNGTINVGSNCVLTIESGTFEVTNGTVPSVINAKFGTAIIKGGTFINTAKYGYGASFTDSKVIVDGGAFIIANEDPDSNCIGIYYSKYAQLCLYRCMVIGNITHFVYDLENILPDECYAYNNTINNMPAERLHFLILPVS